MNDEPTNDNDETHGMDIPDPEESEYPSTLRITSLPAEQAQESTLDRFERAEQGEEVPHVINFEDRSQLRELLTTRRMELIETVMEASSDSIRALADQIDRDVRDVHHDLHLLADYGIVHFHEQGRAKQPYIPYETVRIEVEFGTHSEEGAASPVSA